MADVFISYAAVQPDEGLATELHAALAKHNVSAFMAKISLQPGQRWPDEIRNALRSSPRVIFLASKNACASPYVQQELGGAHYDKKIIIPIVWDMSPGELPGFTSQYHAIDARQGPGPLLEALQKIANDIRIEQRNGVLALVGLAVLFWWSAQK
jgi:hypothetical protein